jgi:hypothetical protein
MKKFFEGVLAWKNHTGLLFSGSVILCSVVSLVLGEEDLSIWRIASLLIFSVAGSLLQMIAFSGRILKRVRYSLRLIVFGVPFFALLVGSAVFFDWFPRESGGAWLSVVVIFLVIFIGMTVGFEIYYAVMGNKYDGLLGQYRKRREGDSTAKP